jgi:hypothetical protein
VVLAASEVGRKLNDSAPVDARVRAGDAIPSGAPVIGIMTV